MSFWEKQRQPLTPNGRRVIELLLSAHANVNALARNFFEYPATALDAAIARKDAETERLLCERGARTAQELER